MGLLAPPFVGLLAPRPRSLFEKSDAKTLTINAELLHFVKQSGVFFIKNYAILSCEARLDGVKVLKFFAELFYKKAPEVQGEEPCINLSPFQEVIR